MMPLSQEEREELDSIRKGIWVIKGGGSVAAIVLFVVVVLAGAYAKNIESTLFLQMTENKQTMKESAQERNSNARAIEHFKAMSEEQDRRFKHIENDIKEIKQGQSELIRKIDAIILERKINSDH